MLICRCDLQALSKSHLYKFFQAFLFSGVKARIATEQVFPGLSPHSAELSVLFKLGYLREFIFFPTILFWEKAAKRIIVLNRSSKDFLFFSNFFRLATSSCSQGMCIVCPGSECFELGPSCWRMTSGKARMILTHESPNKCTLVCWSEVTN